jgi:spermidine/putrescine transport system substrate-binding protein
MKKPIVRSAIVLFWVAFILGLLYWPGITFFKSAQKSINIFAWGDILEPSVIADFEKQTGVKVNLNFFASNEELLVKLKATGGAGYDLIVPSDYSVEVMAREGLLKPLDKSKMLFYSQLNPSLLGHPFDPQNTYSVPFEWEIFLLGVDKTFFAGKVIDPSWKMIFDKKSIDYRIAMVSDPVEAIQMAAFYLYGPIKELTSLQLKEVVKHLTEQKSWVAAYAASRADYFLATKNCPVIVSSSSYIWRSLKKFPFISYLIPKEGTFITIENFCIPKYSQKEDLVYQLINFLFQPKSMAQHFESFGTFPATQDVLPFLELSPDIKELLFSSNHKVAPYHFFHLITSQENIRDSWVQIKSAKLPFEEDLKE